jgi:hypothetical protein
MVNLGDQRARRRSRRSVARLGLDQTSARAVRHLPSPRLHRQLGRLDGHRPAGGSRRILNVLCRRPSSSPSLASPGRRDRHSLGIWPPSTGTRCRTTSPGLGSLLASRFPPSSSAILLLLVFGHPASLFPLSRPARGTHIARIRDLTLPAVISASSWRLHTRVTPPRCWRCGARFVRTARAKGALAVVVWRHSLRTR